MCEPHWPLQGSASGRSLNLRRWVLGGRQVVRILRTFPRRAWSSESILAAIASFERRQGPVAHPSSEVFAFPGFVRRSFGDPSEIGRRGAVSNPTIALGGPS
jgi:hypothetical protein